MDWNNEIHMCRNTWKSRLGPLQASCFSVSWGKKNPEFKSKEIVLWNITWRKRRLTYQIFHRNRFLLRTWAIVWNFGDFTFRPLTISPLHQFSFSPHNFDRFSPRTKVLGWNIILYIDHKPKSKCCSHSLQFCCAMFQWTPPPFQTKHWTVQIFVC